MTIHIESYIVEEKRIVLIACHLHVSDIIFIRCFQIEMLVWADDEIKNSWLVQHQKINTL